MFSGSEAGDLSSPEVLSKSAMEKAQALCFRLEHLWGTNLSEQARKAGATGRAAVISSVPEMGSVGVYLSGTVVADFVLGSPASSSGLMLGDKILRVDGTLVDTAHLP